MLLVNELFKPSSAELSDQGLDKLAALATHLDSTYTRHRFRIEGHADKAGPDRYNAALSLRRARSFGEALMARGVPAEVREAGIMAGCTPRQMLWRVEVPAAREALEGRGARPGPCRHSHSPGPLPQSPRCCSELS